MPPKRGKLNSNHYLLHFRHFGTPEKQRFWTTLGSPNRCKNRVSKPTPQKVTKNIPKSDKKGVPKGAKRVPWEPQNAGCGIQSTAQALLGLKSAAQAPAARGGGPRLCDDSATRISGVPTPLPDPPWKQEKSRTRSWKDSTTRAEKEGKHEGKVISHTPYTLLRRVGGYSRHEGRLGGNRIRSRIFRRIGLVDIQRYLNFGTLGLISTQRQY